MNVVVTDRMSLDTTPPDLRRDESSLSIEQLIQQADRAEDYATWLRWVAKQTEKVRAEAAKLGEVRRHGVRLSSYGSVADITVEART